MPPWLCATQMSSDIGSTRCRAIDWRIRILPTTGPFPCVMINSLPSSITGNNASPSLAATSTCSDGVPRMPSGCVALPPIAITKRCAMLPVADIDRSPEVLGPGSCCFRMDGSSLAATTKQRPAPKDYAKRARCATFSKLTRYTDDEAFIRSLLPGAHGVRYHRTTVDNGRLSGRGDRNVQKIELANKEALRRILEAQPVLVDVKPAHEVIKGLGRNVILHAGPPITWDRMCGPMRGAICGIAVFEGWSAGLDAAAKAAAAGEF